MDCQENCNNNASSVVAKCEETYPISICSCETMTKRGGDTCQNIFCLNDCGGHGNYYSKKQIDFKL